LSFIGQMIRNQWISKEAMGGLALLISAAFALIWANSPFHKSYDALLHVPLSFRIGDFFFEKDLHFFINDGLMTFFFLVAGMEIRHALHDGALARWQQAALPLVAACGGVIMPALIFLSLNANSVRLSGWAVPTATDIAFAVGILALLGRAIPANLRIILLSLAIIDDVIAVIIIALFYSSGLDASGALIAFLGLVLVFLWQKLRIASAWGYCLPAAILWFGLMQIGIHPSLAGVVLGLVTPVHLMASRTQLLEKMRNAVERLPQNGQETEQERHVLRQIRVSGRDLIAPIIRVPLILAPWASFGVMPVLAFANAGVRLADIDLSVAGSLPILFGVGAGLFIGKPLGVLAATWLAVKFKLCRLPPQLDWAGMALVGILAGIGFTMALFVAMLAFIDAHYLAAAKIGILVGSFLSAFLGLGFGLLYRRRRVIKIDDDDNAN